MENQQQGDFLKPSASASLTSAELETRLNGAYTVVAAVSAAVVILSLGLGFLLWWQTRMVRRQLAQSRQAIANYQRIEEPTVNEILTKLEQYGAQNKDYQPLLQKYGMLFPGYQQPAAGAVKAPAPATAPAAPPAGTPKAGAR